MIPEYALKKHVFQLLPVRAPLECPPDVQVIEVAKMLRSKDHDAVVITTNKVVAGIFTQRDYMHKILEPVSKILFRHRGL